MTDLKVTIREATPADHGMLLLLADECLLPLARRAGHPERYQRSRLLELFRRAQLYVAESEGREIAGWVAFEEDGGDVELRCFCVNPGFEAEKVANHLLDWVEGLAIARGRERLTAFVPTVDGPSLHLYHGHGFTTHADEERPDMIVVDKPLPRG
ncbi:MAG TPA: GNAT family N-acetyltransferase [Thermoleophilia bacterium]|nr:GNAT family N-acetyltransferase [Thermoleophilia bacterium]HQG03401.1 GNAT family N-acetyltransferase [Thermoleophilia bacterium]HQG54450.1 GNAT family N-acetyltransferase [Thermoleophilia bacterium]HQJ97704.1 GNAT family N-acetyltransferase [Thermoleophilia bacterium]